MPRTLQALPKVPAAGRIRLIAPSSPFDAPVVERGRQWLASQGYVVSPAPDLARADRYLAAPDEARLQELIAALTDPDVDMVMAARGGYGATRLLPLLDAHRERLKAARPRLLCGFSDVTALHLYLRGTLGWRSVHGPVCTTVALETDVSQAHFRDVLAGKAAGHVLHGKTMAGKGFVCGPLVGGNLAVLMALAGTRYWPDVSGAVLLLEDVSELPRRLDRMFAQLWQVTDGLRGVAGVALGYFNDCEDKERGHTAEPTIRSFFEKLEIPVVAGLPVGHLSPNFALPHGGMVCLDAGSGTLKILDEATV